MKRAGFWRCSLRSIHRNSKAVAFHFRSENGSIRWVRSHDDEAQLPRPGSTNRSALTLAPFSPPFFESPGAGQTEPDRFTGIDRDPDAGSIEFCHLRTIDGKANRFLVTWRLQSGGEDFFGL